MSPAGRKQPEPDLPSDPEYAKGYQAGYEQGRDDERAQKRPPLFEAAKRVCESEFLSPDVEIAAWIAELEIAYQERLSRADRALLEGIAKRRRQTADAQKRVQLTVNRPRSPEGRDVAKQVADGRAVTSYEIVR